MLEWVQLQVLAQDQSVLIDSIDYSTRQSWDDTRKKSVQWTVPTDLPSGDHILRAFGNASYPCHIGRRPEPGEPERCGFLLEDRITLHLDANRVCPPMPDTNVSDTPAAGPQEQLGQQPPNQQPPSGDSGNSYAKQNQDAMNKNLDLDENNSSNGIDSSESDDLEDQVEDDSASEDGGEEGNSTGLEIVLDHSAVVLMQDQTILAVLSQIQDYNLSDSTLTLTNGTVVGMADLMDKQTATRFGQTLEDSRLKISNSGGMSRVAPLSSTELVAALHQDPTLIMIPASDSEIEESTHGHFGLSNTGAGNGTQSGHELVQDSKDRYQDKANGAGTSKIELVATGLSMVTGDNIGVNKTTTAASATGRAPTTRRSKTATAGDSDDDDDDEDGSESENDESDMDDDTSGLDEQHIETLQSCVLDSESKLQQAQNAVARNLLEMESLVNMAMSGSVEQRRNVEKKAERRRLRSSWDDAKREVMSDPLIFRSAGILAIATDSIFTHIDRRRRNRRLLGLRFTLLETELDPWLKAHGDAICVKFIHQQTRKYKDWGEKAKADERSDFYCNRKGTKPQAPRRRQQRPGGPPVRTRNRAPTIRIGCQSCIKVIRTKVKTAEGETVRVCIVTYYYGHSHPPPGDSSIGTRHLPESARELISSLLRTGSPVREVLQRIRMDTDYYTRLFLFANKKVARDSTITYKDIFNVQSDIMVGEISKAEDPYVSADLWIEELARNAYVTCHEKGVHYGFTTPWQLGQLMKFGKVLCFDGKRRVYGQKNAPVFLFTLVILNERTRASTPVAFLLSTRTHVSIFKDWFEQLRTRILSIFQVNYAPELVVTNQGNVEMPGIKIAFPNARIEYCAWHVVDTWRTKLETNGILDIAPDADQGEMGDPYQEQQEHPEETKRKILAALESMLYNTDRPRALEEVDNFRHQFGRYRQLMEYMERFHLNERERRRWMICYRGNITATAIDTTPYIGGWQRTLKSLFLSDPYQEVPRIDKGIYMLVKCVIPQCQLDCLSSHVRLRGFSREHTIDAGLAISQATGYRTLFRSSNYLGGLCLKTSDPTVIKVLSCKTGEQSASDTTPDFYLLKLDRTIDSSMECVVACGCPEFAEKMVYCKHIALAILETPPLEFYANPTFRQQELSKEMDNKPVTSHAELSTAPADLEDMVLDPPPISRVQDSPAPAPMALPLPLPSLVSALVSAPAPAASDPASPVSASSVSAEALTVAIAVAPVPTPSAASTLGATLTQAPALTPAAVTSINGDPSTLPSTAPAAVTSLQTELEELSQRLHNLDFSTHAPDQTMMRVFRELTQYCEARFQPKQTTSAGRKRHRPK
ncbi:hypothetical protein BGZ75_002217 [Mortierella antarctica]|nr:hypothetical protein BGZ75_002217 [Mortierella antarctica]